MNEEYTNHVSKDITREIKDFVKEEVFGNSEYLFINKVDGVNKGYCSKCKKEFYIGDVKHNQDGRCPFCEASLKAKLLRYGRQNCLNEACFYFFEKSIIDANVLVCKGYYVTKDYVADYKNPQERYILCAIYIFKDKNATMLKTNCWNNDWNIKSSIFDFNQGWLAPKMCYLSSESIAKAIQGTSYQYIPYKMFEGHYSIVKVFTEYSKYPALEQISKSGFAQIVEAKLKGMHIYSCLNYKGKDMFETLKLSRNDIKEIKKSKVLINPLFLRLYQLQVKDKSGLSPTEVKDIQNCYAADFVRLRNILNHTTMKKAFKYMEKQREKYSKKFSSKSAVTITWSDYIDDCLTLEMNFKDERVLYPKDLHEAHQETLVRIKTEADALMDRKIDERLNSLERYCFEYNGLMIRPAVSTKELIREGKALKHCVGNYNQKYMSKYSKGQIVLLLIRKTDNPDNPFATMELEKDVVKQVQGYDNKLSSKCLDEFVKAFKAEKLNMERIRVKNKISVPA
jgi:hypothetical protein